MGAGGKRPGAGRKRTKPENPKVDRNIATRVLAMTGKPIHYDGCQCEECAWWDQLLAQDLRLRFDARKFLTEKRDGRNVQTVNHIHDKPIEMNVTVSMAEAVRKVRERKLAYERDSK